MEEVSIRSKNGTHKTIKREYVRMSKGVDTFVGSWVEKNPLDHVPQLLVSTLGQDELNITFPEIGQHTRMTLDGKASVVRSSVGEDLGTIEATIQSPTRFAFIRRAGTKIVNQGILMLSPDGTRLVEETWRPEATHVRRVMVYNKGFSGSDRSSSH